MREMDFAIETDNLVKVYGGKKEGVRALNGIDMKVPLGSVYGLFGPNGSGKTTLITILVGLQLPTGGSARVLGHDIIKESVNIRRKVGLLPEGFGFYEHMTALENLTFLGTLDDLPPDKVKGRALEVLESTGLKDKAGAKVSTFSRGMRQRLGVAQALMKNPELLMLDEPTVGIDPEGASEFRDLVRGLNKEGKTVLLSTHLLYEIGMICTHAAMIREGKLLAQGTVDELSRPVRDAKGHAYEIHVKSGGDGLRRDIRLLPDVREAVLRDDKITVIAESDIGSALFSLMTGDAYRDQVVSITPVSPSWEELYQFYQGGESA
jgi:ABC-2 type transport system ATP-binding protein